MADIKYDDVVKYWKEHSKNTEDEYERLLNNFWMLQTVHSNNIEDGKLDYHVTREVFEGLPLTSVVGVYPRDIVEAQNSRFTRHKLIDNLIHKTPISPELIKSFHKVYMNGLYDDDRYSKGERPGIYKIHDYRVGMTDEGSEPENVECDMNSLCEELSGISESKILTVAAYFHLKFETIHPFSDGNGRVGRLVTNYLLMYYNHPPINIFLEDKDAYYLALEIFDRTGAISGFEKLLKEQCVKTWKEIVQKSNNNKHNLENAIRLMEGE